MLVGHTNSIDAIKLSVGSDYLIVAYPETNAPTLSALRQLGLADPIITISECGTSDLLETATTRGYIRQLGLWKPPE